MLVNLPHSGVSLFDESRRIENEMDELHGRSAWLAGIRSAKGGLIHQSMLVPPLNRWVGEDGAGQELAVPTEWPNTMEQSVIQEKTT